MNSLMVIRVQYFTQYMTVTSLIKPKTLQNKPRPLGHAYKQVKCRKISNPYL